MKHVIIGGVAAGATAAARIRRMDENAEIVILEKGPYISYANCGLPYYIGGVISERSNLFVQTPESFSRRFNINVQVNSEAVDIDTEAKTVSVKGPDGQIHKECYDKLLLSPGAIPVRPPIKGIDSEGIFTLRDVEDTDAVKEYLKTHNVRKAAIVGAGFIGLEMAENLSHAGASVSIVEMGNQVMAPVDYSTACHVHEHLRSKGVNLYLEHSVEGFEKTGDSIRLELSGGKSIVADIVILSIGVRPRTDLAVKAGLKLGESGGIAVNEYLQTSAEDVYAAGDAIEFRHPLTGKTYLNYLANPANRQGRIVAENMVSGNRISYEGAIGTSIAKVFDLTVASTGLAAKRLKQAGIPYISSTTHSASHAGYYPDAIPMSIKLVFSPEGGKILGAQAVGFDGVDKRIDEIAMLIKNGGTIYDLMMTEHCYAPPFSSAKDPVAIAGYAAGNILNGTMPVVYWRQMLDADPEKVMLLDVRTAEEFSYGSINGAVNIPLDDLRERISEIPEDRDIYIFCAVGLRGYLAQRILIGRGYTRVWNLSGGYKTFCAVTGCYTEADSKHNEIAFTDDKTVLKVNACGLQCPGPVMKVKEAIEKVKEGERIEIISTDAGFARDSQAWCSSTGNKLISRKEDKGRYTVVIEKGGNKQARTTSTEPLGKTLIMFSDDLDKALATFVLANGAAATGKKTTIFFTFWGLNTIKKTHKPKVRKDIFGKMFGMMLPSSSLSLHLSKMSFLGIGDKMMRHIMKKKQIESLEELRQQALDNGVEFIACQMSMDVMGIQKEELLDEVTVGGVATYMERAEKANVNLFI